MSFFGSCALVRGMLRFEHCKAILGQNFYILLMVGVGALGVVFRLLGAVAAGALAVPYLGVVEEQAAFAVLAIAVARVVKARFGLVARMELRFVSDFEGIMGEGTLNERSGVPLSRRGSVPTGGDIDTSRLWEDYLSFVFGSEVEGPGREIGMYRGEGVMGYDHAAVGYCNTIYEYNYKASILALTRRIPDIIKYSNKFTLCLAVVGLMASTNLHYLI